MQKIPQKDMQLPLNEAKQQEKRSKMTRERRTTTTKMLTKSLQNEYRDANSQRNAK